jgi:RimJ/RimL family protein N-acetyltransferase
LIFENEDQPFGFVQFSDIFDACGTEWGFYVSPNAPKGTGFALGQAAIRFAFTQLAVDKIIGNVMEHNVPSLRFHEKLGFAQNPNKNNSSHMLSFELTFEVWLQCLEMQHQEVVQ